MPITYTSQDQVEVYRFSAPVAIGIPLVALFLQAFLPLRLHFFSLFDLPLLVVIFFAVARRSPVAGLLTGSLIGLLQDSLTHQPIGMYGIAKTVVGFGASSLGAKLDVDNVGARFLVTLFFYAVHEVVYFTVARGTGEIESAVELGPRNRGRPAERSHGGRPVYSAGQVQAEGVKRVLVVRHWWLANPRISAFHPIDNVPPSPSMTTKADLPRSTIKSKVIGQRQRPMANHQPPRTDD